MRLMSDPPGAGVLSGWFQNGTTDLVEVRRVLGKSLAALCLKAGTDRDWKIWESDLESLRTVPPELHTAPQLVVPARMNRLWSISKAPAAFEAQMHVRNPRRNI